ncbi:o-succinylbenzoate--CoA ligase, partial [Escherichia coli]|nr:o-succinylbenzoate--CoA ligase [Escherichia coli]
HLASARGSASVIPLDAECGWLLSLPLFHVGGYANLFRVFLAGASLVLDDRSHPLRERLEQQPITHLSLVPTQLWRLLA